LSIEQFWCQFRWRGRHMAAGPLVNHLLSLSSLSFFLLSPPLWAAGPEPPPCSTPPLVGASHAALHPVVPPPFLLVAAGARWRRQQQRRWRADSPCSSSVSSASAAPMSPTAATMSRLSALRRATPTVNCVHPVLPWSYDAAGCGACIDSPEPSPPRLQWWTIRARRIATGLNLRAVVAASASVTP
jgi:hypothetical protein